MSAVINIFKITLITFLITHKAASQNSDSVYQFNSISDSANLTINKDHNFKADNLTNHYIYKPNEAVSIQVFPDSTSFFNNIYKIDDNGCIIFPVIGNLQISTMTESQLIDTIKSRCIDYLPFPNIKISSLIRLSLFGGFYKPGLYWVDSRNSIWDAIQLAGGLQREDGLKLLRWERNGKIVSNNLINQFQSGESLKSMGFQSGDQLCITSRPKTEFSFREDVFPLFTLFLTTLTTGLTIYNLTK
jgi:protein involved in polysaccharide export with SLBB domain